MTSSSEQVRAVAKLPGVDIEIVHRPPQDGGGEAVGVMLRTNTSFDALAANPWAAMQALWLAPFGLDKLGLDKAGKGGAAMNPMAAMMNPTALTEMWLAPFGLDKAGKGGAAMNPMAAMMNPTALTEMWLAPFGLDKAGKGGAKSPFGAMPDMQKMMANPFQAWMDLTQAAWKGWLDMCSPAPPSRKP